jgi:putative transcriptional regulator
MLVAFKARSCTLQIMKKEKAIKDSADTALSSSLTGQLLIAMPSLGDPRFHRAVIFICSHDQGGAMGLVINHRAHGMEFGELLSRIQMEPLEKNDNAEIDMAIHTGGPVEPARGFLLHTPDFRQPDTVLINDNFSVSGTIDALRAIAGGGGAGNAIHAGLCRMERRAA